MNYLKCKQFLLLIMIILVCLSFSYSTKAGEQTDEKRDEILIFASSMILEENMARAREEAIKEAMFKGIENYLIYHLGKQRISDNFILLAQEIIPRAAEYIENYHILAQERIGDTYKVFLSLRINEAMIEKKLNEFDILALEGTQKKILFLVSEFNTVNNEERYWWRDPGGGVDLTPVELALFRSFQDKGFYPVNRLIGLADETYDLDMKTPLLTMANAIKWGRLYSADIVIQGRFELVSDESIVVDIKAMNVHQAELISQLNYIQMPDKNLSKSKSPPNMVELAAKTAAQKLGPAIIQSMDKQEPEITRIKIHLSGLKSLKQQKIFLDYFQTKVKGVQLIVPVEVKKRSISYSVHYLGDAVSLIKFLSSDSGFPLEASIQMRTENEISIVIL